MTISIRKGEDIKSEPNVVPLCDVLLVLLIIFMIATPLIHKGVDVTIPSALNTINMPQTLEVILSIKKDGTMFLKEEQVTKENLPTAVEEALLNASDKRLYLRADEDLEFGNIVEIITLLKEAGVDVVGIITEPKTERGKG
jgi:biopolymer transport protein TolR